MQFDAIEKKCNKTLHHLKIANCNGHQHTKTTEDEKLYI